MNKTVTINLSGIIFHIEEDAYERLSKYLSTIKGYFQTADGKEEIISDIESRIAELLREKTNEIKQVVVMSDVDYVISIMGQPEDFAGDAQENQNNNQNSSQNENTASETKARKRVFRDPDSKVIGGVCGGIGAYFDFDPVFMRVAFVVLFLLSVGFVIPLYIIMWIVIPEAKTTAEKLEMRGEKVDVNNISKAFRESSENMRKRVNDLGEEIKGSNFAKKDNVDKFVDFLKTVLYGIGRVLAGIIGFFMVFIGIILMIALIASVFGFATIDNAKVSDIHSLLFHNGQYTFLAVITAILLIGVPLVMIIYKGIKMLLRIRYSNKWINLGAGIMWGIGVILAFTLTSLIVKEFSGEAKVKQSQGIYQNVGDTLYIKANVHDYLNLEMMKDKNYSMVDFGHEKYILREENGVTDVVGIPRLDIVQSDNDSIQLFVTRNARGKDKKDAYDRAGNIKYSFAQEDSVFVFNNYFTFDPADKWRAQEVNIVMKVPKNKVIVLDRSLRGLIYDIDNVTGTFDSDMLGRRWIMRAEGLTCIDCNGLDTPEQPMPPAHPVIINKEGVNITAEDAQVKIGKEGIHVEAKDANVKIDEKGINIKTKDKSEK